MSSYTVHKCTSQPKGVFIEYSGEVFHDDFTWQISYLREATEEDLENNHYLEQVGEILWSFVAELKYCPYCGLELSKNLKNGGEFVLFNSLNGSVDIL